MRYLLTILCLALAVNGLAAGLLQNTDFEAGLAGWSLAHSWYAQPADAGTSEIVLGEGEGRDGGNALKIIGGGKRGLAMQTSAAFPGTYRVGGWIKCENLGDAQASILAEWMGRDERGGLGRWIKGDSPGGITGTTDWTYVEQQFDAPPDARGVHLDLLVNVPNEGTVWFDDIILERVPGGLPVPASPDIRVETPVGEDACFQVTWDAAALTPGTVTLLIYCEPEPLSDPASLIPRAVADADTGSGFLRSLGNGTTYHVAAVAVNGDGQRSTISQGIQATAADRQAPRPGWIEAYSTDTDDIRVCWSPHVLDTDVVALEIGTERDGQFRSQSKCDVAGIYDVQRPLYTTIPLFTSYESMPEGTTRVGVRCIDRAGNVGEVEWLDVEPQPQSDAALPAELWTAPPTEQLPVDAAAPPERSDAFSLSLMQNQSRGFQVMLKPQADLQQVRVSFAPLAHEDGESFIDPRWLAYHFVNYVTLEANSRATPEDELVWQAPGEYPDELSDDLVRDLPAGRLQPIYIRVTAPEGAEPGRYTGRGSVWSPQGTATLSLTVQVEPVAFPAEPRLKFVYWSSWNDPCEALGVTTDSEDGWRVLARQGELMRTHHQNTVVISYALIRSWRDENGELRHDWTAFDRTIRTFQEQGVDALFCLSHMGSRTSGEWECPTMRSHGYTVRDLQTGQTSQIDVLDVLPDIEAHVESLGLIDSFCVHVADEPIPVNLESYKALSARVKAAAPRLRRIDAIHVPDLLDSLEIWVPQLNYLKQWEQEYRAAQQAGNELWFYIAWVPQGLYPNRMIDSYAIKSRVLHWMNALYDTTGYLHWALDRWSIPLTSLGSPGDQYICWPSRRYVANSSLRYEAEREGLEDCELMFMVRDKLMQDGKTREEAQAEMERIGRQAVEAYEDFTRDYAEMERVRAELIEALGR